MTYTDLTPGVAFMYEGKPYIVISGEFHRMQMRKAVMHPPIQWRLLNKSHSKRTGCRKEKATAPI